MDPRDEREDDEQCIGAGESVWLTKQATPSLRGGEADEGN